jgi:hypothetical protein
MRLCNTFLVANDCILVGFAQVRCFEVVKKSLAQGLYLLAPGLCYC